MVLTDGMCPVCSGRGYTLTSVSQERRDCGLCHGTGFVDSLTLERFWHCAKSGYPTMCTEKARGPW